MGWVDYVAYVDAVDEMQREAAKAQAEAKAMQSGL
jgi:hypothetical protein